MSDNTAHLTLYRDHLDYTVLTEHLVIGHGCDEEVIRHWSDKGRKWKHLWAHRALEDK